MSLDLNQVSETLNKYFPGQMWRAALPVETDPPEHDEYGNILAGLEWNSSNTVQKPSVEKIEELWNEIEKTGEWGQEFPGVPGFGDGFKFFGKTSDYAQALLKDSDWAALPDVNLTDECQKSWNEYRSKLREIRSNPRQNPEWPSKPKVEYK